MPKVKARKQSKRQTLKQKYKINKKVKEHNRKKRREQRLNPKRLKKDPGIPNLYPHKEALLRKMERSRAADQKARKDRRARVHEQRRSLESMVASAQAREAEFEERAAELEEQHSAKTNLGRSSRRAFFKEFKKVVEAADVILQVLDARDPLGCRSLEVERAILRTDPTKRIILILNKVDLIPRENATAWLKYLRAEYPTIAFKCATQRISSAKAIGSAERADEDLLKSSECIGADSLIQLLKNYCRNHKIKTSVTVGVVGYPNVGKSSLINSLKRSRAVGVGATPGFTRSTQEVHIDKQVKLIDSPGIVFSGSDSDAMLALRNCVRADELVDPIAPVEYIVQKSSRPALLATYEIADFEDTQEFLAHLCRKRGRLKRGGVPDYEASARGVIHDWTSGKIKYFTAPPKREGVVLEASVVPQWSAEFDISSVADEEVRMVSSLPRMGQDVHRFNVEPAHHGVAPGTLDDGLVAYLEHGEDAVLDEVVMEEDDDGVTVVFDTPDDDDDDGGGGGDSGGGDVSSVRVYDEEDALNPLNRRKQMKQREKQRKRNQKRGIDDPEHEENFAYKRRQKSSSTANPDLLNEDEAFDFAVDFQTTDELFDVDDLPDDM